MDITKSSIQNAILIPSRQENKDFTGPALNLQLRQLPHPGQNDDVQNSEILCASFNDASLKSQSYNNKNFENDISYLQGQQQFQDNYSFLENKRYVTSCFSKNNSSLRNYYHFNRESLKSFIHLFDLTEQKPSRFHFIPSKTIFALMQILAFFFQLTLKIYIPLVISFRLNDYLYLLIIWKFINIFMILINMQFPNGKKIKEKKEFIKIYIQEYMLLDAICIIMIVIIEFLRSFSDEEQIIAWILYLFLIFSQRNLNKYLLQYVKSKTKAFSRMKSFIFFSIQFLLNIHILICFWNGIITQEYFDLTSSYLRSASEVISIFSMNSFFQPDGDIQNLIFILYSIIAIFLQGHILINFINFFTLDFPQKFVNQFLQNNPNLDIELQQQIISELENHPYEGDSQLIKCLSLEVVKKIHYQQRFELLKNFFRNYSEQTIERLIEICEEIHCTGGQQIIKESNVDDNAIYFIKEGYFSVELKQGQPLQIIQKGQTFGEISFFTQQPRQATVVSQGNGKILKIRRDLFLQIISHNDRERFAYQKDLILFASELPITCYYCKSKSHLIKYCPRLTYQPSQDFILFKSSNDSIEQQRVEIRRKKVRKSLSSWKYDFQQIDADFFNYLFCEKWNYKYEPPSNFINYDDIGENEFESPQLRPTRDFTSIPISIDQFNADEDFEILKQESLKKKQKLFKLGSDNEKGNHKNVSMLKEIENGTFKSLSDEQLIYDIFPKEKKKKIQSSPSQKYKIKPPSCKSSIPSYKSITQKRQSSPLVLNPSHKQLRSSLSSHTKQSLPIYEQIEFQRIGIDIDKMFNFDVYYRTENVEDQIRKLQNNLELKFQELL